MTLSGALNTALKGGACRRRMGQKRMSAMRELYPSDGRDVLIIGGGIKICVEQIEELKATEGIQGLHLMTLEWDRW